MNNVRLYSSFIAIASLTLVMGLSSCRESMESNDNLTIIYPNVSFDNEVDDKVELSAVFPSYRIIKLETLPESLIGGPNTKVIKHGNMFYVRSINEVLVFDEDGKFVKKLSRLG